MKITDVRSALLYAPFDAPCADASRPACIGRDVIVISVETDAGVTGLGFLTGMGIAGGQEIYSVLSILQTSVRALAVGMDALHIEEIWSKLYRDTTRFGRKGAAVRAISGVDMALWDIRGKVAGLPLHILAGGNSDRVRAYASGGFYYPEDDFDRVAEELSALVKRGFTAVKMKVGRDPKYDLERVRRVRAAIGDAVDLMLDANEGWDFVSAYWFVRQVESYNICFLEEPCAPDDLTGYAELAKRSPIPIAAGENEYTKWGFRDLIVSRAVHILQPDVTRVGGITEWLKVAALAQAFGMRVMPHSVNEIHASLAAAVPNVPMMEFFPSSHSFQTFLSQLWKEPHTTHELIGGCVCAPNAPGLGLELDEAVFQAHLVPGFSWAREAESGRPFF